MVQKRLRTQREQLTALEEADCASFPDVEGMSAPAVPPQVSPPATPAPDAAQPAQAVSAPPRLPPALFTCAQLDAVQSQVGSGRVKYSCIDVSSRLLLLGANTGSIYMFNRPNIEFLRLWSHTDISDSLSCIKINPSEKLFAVSSVRGQVYIIQVAKPGEKDQVLLKITDHKEAEITALLWQDNVTILSGDDAGCIFLSSLSNAGMFFQADLLYKTDSRVVQLDISSSRVLVSSLTKCSILDVAKRSVVHVGTRPRDGRFGGCFLNTEQLLAARPGKRLWIAENSTGKVLNTLTFTTSPVSQASNFTRLLPFAMRVATWDESTVFILNVADVQVSAEYSQLGAVLSAAACDNELFVVGGGGRVVAVVKVLPPREFVIAKANSTEWRAALDAALTYRILLLSVLRPLQQKLLATDPNAADAPALALLIAEAEAAEQDQLRREMEAAQKRQEEEEARKKKAEEERIAREREAERKREEKRKADEEARRIEEERRKAEEERRKAEEEKRKAEEERRREEKRKADEERRKADEERRKADEEKRKADEERRRAEEERIKKETPEGASTGTSVVPLVPGGVAVVSGLAHALASSTPLPDLHSSASEPEPLPASQPEPLAVKRKHRLKRTIDVMPLSSGPLPPAQPPSSTPPILHHSHSMPVIERSSFASAAPSRPPSDAVGAPAPAATPSPVVTKALDTRPAKPEAPLPSTSPQTVSAIPPNPIPTPAPPTATPAPPTAAATSPFIPPANPAPAGSGPAQPRAPSPHPPLERGLSLSALGLPSSASQLLSNTKSLVAPLDSFLDRIDRLAGAVPIKGSASTQPPQPPVPTNVSRATLSSSPLPTSALAGAVPPSSVAAPAPTQPAPVSAPLPAATDTRPHLLTQTVHEAVMVWRTTMRVGQLSALLAHWLSTYDPANPPPRVPNSWLTDILTANFEINSRSSWSEEAAMEFVTKYGAQLDPSAVFAASNRAKWRQCTAAALELSTKQMPDAILAAQYFTLQRYLNETSDVRAAVELLKTQANWVWVAQSLPRLLELKSQAAVSLAVSSFPPIQPWKVLEILGGNEAAVREYLTGLMAHEEARATEELVQQWLAALLRDAPPADQLFISIGMPKRGALSVVWPQQASLDELLSKPGYYSYSSEEALSACLNAGYFRGLLQLAARQNNTALELEIALQVDDVAAFDAAAQRTSSDAMWQQVLAQAMQLRAVDQRRGETEARKVSKERIVSAVLATMGPEAAAELLLRDESFVDDVQPQVFPAFVTAFERQAEERAVVHRMLETLDAFMWSPKPLALAPQLKNLRDQEIAGTALQTPYVTEEDGKPVVAFDETPLPEFLEQRHHWGVELSTTARCPGCTLPLREEVGPNIIVFHCGHAFHQPCITEEACRVCFLAKSTSLLRPGQFPLP